MEFFTFSTSRQSKLIYLLDATMIKISDCFLVAGTTVRYRHSRSRQGRLSRLKSSKQKKKGIRVLPANNTQKKRIVLQEVRWNSSMYYIAWQLSEKSFLCRSFDYNFCAFIAPHNRRRRKKKRAAYLHPISLRRALGRSENPGGRGSGNVVCIICPPVGIGLTDLPKFLRGGCPRTLWPCFGVGNFFSTLHLLHVKLETEKVRKIYGFMYYQTSLYAQ